MKKRGGISGTKMSKIYSIFEDINLVGSGAFIYSELCEAFQQLDAAYMICSLDEAKKIDVEAFGKMTRAIAIKIDQSSLISESSFETYFLQKVQSVINQTPLLKKMFKYFVINWHSGMNNSVLKAALLTLQLMNHFTIIFPIINPASWLDYQAQLFNFTHHVLQTDSLVLSTISVIVKLPNLESADYSKEILSIWRRVIPAALGRLVIQDWIDCGLPNSISQLFGIKNMEIPWQLQFLTSHLQRYETLSQHILGIL